MSDPTRDDVSCQTPPAAVGWSDCTEGLLGACANRQLATVRRSRVRYAAGAVVSGCLLLVAALAWNSGWQDSGAGDGQPHVSYPKYGGLTCTQALERMDSYLVQQVDEEDRGRIRQHLADCKSCQRAFELRAEALNTTVAFRRQPAASSCIGLFTLPQPLLASYR